MNSMRRLLAIVLLTLLTAGSLPSLAQARLICRMTGVEMQPVAVKDDPRSCCAIREKLSGGAELAEVGAGLHDEFAIEHATIQVEAAKDAPLHHGCEE